MPISTSVPHEIRVAFESGIADFLGESSVRQFAGILGKSVGLQVFALRLDRLDRGLDAAVVPAGWMFLTGAAPDPVMSSDVYDPGRGLEPRIVNVSRESGHEKIRRMAAALDGLPETRDANYEMRVLRIPALSIEALWLKSPGGQQQDLVVPFLSLVNEIRTGIPYRAAEFLANLDPLVKRTQLPPRNGR